MGNSAEISRNKNRSIHPNKSKFSRNSYSLDSNSMFSQYMDKVEKDGSSIKGREASIGGSAPILLDSIAQLARPQIAVASPEVKSLQVSPETIMKKSYSLSLDKPKLLPKMQNDSRLSKLNQRNDELRKQLIKISSQLTTQLKRKKFQQKKKEVQIDTKDDPLVLMALRRELQSGYKQIARVKKHIQNLKKLQGNARNEDLMNQVQAKISAIEFDASQILFEIENARSVNFDQRTELKDSKGITDYPELDVFKQQIEKLRKYSKKQYKNERVRFQKEKIMQQYMFQLERKKRYFNGEYLPQIKSYANKNYVPEPTIQKKKTGEYANYKPAAWQLRSVEEEVRSLKEKHEEYHVRMDKALRAKNNIKQEHQKIKQDLESAAKDLELLVYKKERYLQMVMGNLQFLMNEFEVESEGEQIEPQYNATSFKVVTKGNDVPDQKPFDDHNLIKNINYAQVRIVSVNIWFTNKHQISALQMIYSYGKDCFLGNKTSSVSGEMEKEMLQLEEGDYIKNIMGIFNKKGAIEFMAFYSAKGKARQFGKEMVNGLNFALGLTRRERPVCISGCSFFDGNYWRINKLVVDVASQG